MAGNLARGNDLRVGQGTGLKIFTIAGALVLLLPLVILVVYSFNSSKSVVNLDGFSLKWYAEIFRNQSLWISLKNSIIIALISTAFTTVLATMAALLIGKYSFRGRALFQNLLYVPVILPEIIFGVSLLALYLMIGFPLGIISIICAHITFSFPFSTLVILSKVMSLPPSLEEASLDLGAGKWQTFHKVILPYIMPGIVSGALFAFTLSIDDFIVTFFTAGAGASTLPLKIFSMIKYGLTPAINAISVVIIIFTMAALYISNKIQNSSRISKKVKLGLGGFFLVIILVLYVAPLFVKENKEVNLYTYSGYIDEDLLVKFKEETGIKVNIDYFNDNEELLSKLKMGVSGYDVVTPSDYMVQILKEQELITPIDFSNIPNIVNIDNAFRKKDFDLNGEYSVPYTYGFSAIVYDSEKIKDTIDSWQDMWNPAYKGNILMLDDMRETFFVGYKLVGKPFDNNRESLQEALNKLIEQKPLLLKYEAVSTQELMEGGDAWIAHAWNGMIERLLAFDPKFKYCMPREGSLFFVDNLCIPTLSENKENAELFMNFLLRPENSAANMMKIRYAMPNEKARMLLDSALRENRVIFPKIVDPAKIELLKDLGGFAAEIDKAWTELKVN